MLGPSVKAGILKPADLAGYRRSVTCIPPSRHVPPGSKAVRTLMPALFDLLREEKEASVRVVLGHFFFVQIQPYFKSNGLLARFLMNAMLASGGYPWTIIPLAQHTLYKHALATARAQEDIRPFAQFLAKLVTPQ